MARGMILVIGVLAMMILVLQQTMATENEEVSLLIRHMDPADDFPYARYFDTEESDQSQTRNKRQLERPTGCSRSNYCGPRGINSRNQCC